ncbi:MAG: 50S ribosomal protein L24 [Microgenomates group bacterium GW2011_GWC1_43_13]|uniref:Large ribosomal subunit protein uL24 n=3 Tax=Candidatus Woeseibacteriota TaxID=1752722 RepID=A0A837IE07_9BACT|nr:MAG: 50S ribosomal protein L24 [Microgenomates group bacterium GW2011_GWC1_43_13]KKT33546.1 MAG: 50S ribosomal protein L24 [Candidatus Woesebacteria bacterium GW2011_GWB1_44_11]KKT55035.1 MAG: 50S ribosomal protein L24 [Candidatus Woesebacteria bacterium GW2011_GWA1_44_23]OGM76853.1 MAG: 50S ribosomal protein L24 [Candidatus Woesebacteria bacterium RIFOXYA1_FULL_43_16]OGM83248.1 MAG: 50S ribosomal protein L24 [Candidatus Woesebacteria bacterium RIFOXYB1_FULL_42_36]OGM85048.1 MAG: 50S riboso
MIKFKKGDTVKIMIGKDKGREAKIEKILPTEGKVLIPGVNLYKKHVKGFGDVKGGVYDIPRPLDFGKIALVCPKCKKITRVGFKFAGEDKVRVCKKCRKEIDTK